MKIESDPKALGFIAGAFVLLLGVLANASCSHTPAPKQPMKEVLIGARDSSMQATATVKIITNCGTGSGVLIDDHHVLTAAHVINCSDWPELSPPGLTVVETLDGDRHIVTKAWLDGEKDLARLTLSRKVPGITPVPVRHAKTGDTVCIAHATPDRGIKCGKVGELGGPRDQGDVELKDGNVWFGNSGSGVYDSSGALVGLAVRLKWCDQLDAIVWAYTGIPPKTTCGGRISSLDDSEVIPWGPREVP